MLHLNSDLCKQYKQFIHAGCTEQIAVNNALPALSAALIYAICAEHQIYCSDVSLMTRVLLHDNTAEKSMNTHRVWML